MSNKFTGITSGGQFIPVYDKDTHSALSGKQDKLSAGNNIQIENNIISVTGEMGKVYSGEGGVTVDNINDKISLDASAQSAIEAFKGEFDLSAGTNISFRTEGQTVYIDSDAAPLPEYVTEAANYVSAQSGTWDSVTGKQDAGDYYSATNPSGFLIADDITGKMDVTAMTAYQPAGDYQPSGDYLSASESANFYPMTGNPSGFLTEHQSLDGLMETSGLEYDGDKISGYMGSAFAGGGSVPEGVMVESAVGYNAVNEISGYNGSAIAQYGAEKQWLVHDDTLVHAANSAQYALGVNVSAVQTLMGLDETVLFSGNCSSGQSFTAVEPVSAFDRYKIYLRNTERQQQTVIEKYIDTANTGNANNWVTLDCFQAGGNGQFFTINCGKGIWDNTFTVFSYDGGYAAWMGNDLAWHQITNTNSLPVIQKVIGIGRKEV